MKKFMTTCDEATAISDKDQYKEATSWELIKLGFHTMMCKSCKVYTIQNKSLTKIIEYKAIAEKKALKTLSDTDKVNLKKEVASRKKQL